MTRGSPNKSSSPTWMNPEPTATKTNLYKVEIVNENTGRYVFTTEGIYPSSWAAVALTISDNIRTGKLDDIDDLRINVRRQGIQTGKYANASGVLILDTHWPEGSGNPDDFRFRLRDGEHVRHTFKTVGEVWEFLHTHHYELVY